MCIILWQANLPEIRDVDETSGCLDETVWNLVKRVDISISLSVFLSLSISFVYLWIYLCILGVLAFVHSDFVVSDSRGSPAF